MAAPVQDDPAKEVKAFQVSTGKSKLFDFKLGPWLVSGTAHQGHTSFRVFTKAAKENDAMALLEPVAEELIVQE